MGVRTIITYPDPVLKGIASPVSTFDAALHRLLDDMADTMYHYNGIGLAAPQINVPVRIAVVDVSRDGEGVTEFINPEIISSEGEVPSEEGCLSIPGYRDTIRRHEFIVVRSQNRQGEHFEVELSELFAICVQHEIDHLNGVLFIDRLSRLKRDLFKRQFKKGKSLED